MKGEGLLVLLAPSCERGFGHVGRGAKKSRMSGFLAPPPLRARRPSTKLAPCRLLQTRTHDLLLWKRVLLPTTLVLHSCLWSV